MVKVLPHHQLVVAMGDRLYNALSKYFTVLSNTGYMNKTDTLKLYVYVTIVRLFYTTFREYMTEQDYKIADKALYCLYGSSCLIPYPDFCTGNGKDISMEGLYNMEYVEEYIIPELNRLSQIVGEISNKDIVIPGGYSKDVPDIIVSD